MNYNQVLQYIVQWIYENHANKITGYILQDVLIEMLQYVKANDDNFDIDIQNLQNQIDNITIYQNLNVFEGIDNPNVTPPTDPYDAPDIYVKTDTDDLFIFSGTEWVQLTNQPEINSVLTEFRIDNLGADTDTAVVNFINNLTPPYNKSGNENIVITLYENDEQVKTFWLVGAGKGLYGAGQNQISVDNLVSFVGNGSGGGGIPDAPSDGKTYGRKNEAWTEITDGIETNNTPDIELSGDGTGGNPIEAELTNTVKNDIQKGVTAQGWGNHADAGYLTQHQDISEKEDKVNKVQNLTNPNSTTYPSTQAIADLDLDDFKNESSDPFVRESEISDIELDGIGTRNYLHNSDFSLPNPLGNVLGNGNSRSVADGNILATVTNKAGSQHVGFKNISVNDIGEFTFSIKIKATTSVDRWLFSAAGLVGFTGSNKFIDVTGDWQILTWNLTNSTSGSDKTIRLYLQNAEIGDTVEIEWVKLEKTNIHSDWTPSPEDQKEWANLRFLRYDTDSQNLTPTEQENARANLGLNIIPSVIALMHGEAEEEVYFAIPNLQWDIKVHSMVLVSRDTVTGQSLIGRILLNDTEQTGTTMTIPTNERASNEITDIDWDAGDNIDVEVTQTGSTDAGSNLALYIFYSLRS